MFAGVAVDRLYSNFIGVFLVYIVTLTTVLSYCLLLLLGSEGGVCE